MNAYKKIGLTFLISIWSTSVFAVCEAELRAVDIAGRDCEKKEPYDIAACKNEERQKAYDEFRACIRAVNEKKRER